MSSSPSLPPLQIKVIGHRGSGASDSKFNRDRDTKYRTHREAEGTLLSHYKALSSGADGIELDAIETADGYIVCTHADEVQQHILTDFTPSQPYIGRMQYQEVKDIPVGPHGSGRIPLLKEIFQMVLTDFPGRYVNVELKGKQKNFDDGRDTSPSLAEKVLKVVEETAFPLHQIVFSSFSHMYLKELRALSSKAQIGILYNVFKPAGTDLRLFREPCDDVYHPFTQSSLEFSLRSVENISSVHPEIRTVTADLIKTLVDHNIRRLACWAWCEYSPLHHSEDSEEFVAAAKNAIDLCREFGLQELWIITDHVEDMRRFLQRDPERQQI